MSFDEEDAEKAFRELDRYINRFSNGATLAEKLANNHPTLQQNTMRFFVAFVRAMAANEWPDDRNRASVNLAKELVRQWGDGPYLPFI